MDDERYMREALREAMAAAEEDEVPIGAVVVCRGRIIAKGHNMTERLKDPTAHAEMIAITSDGRKISDRLHTVCDCRTLPYVCRSTCMVTDQPCRVRGSGSEARIQPFLPVTDASES